MTTLKNSTDSRCLQAELAVVGTAMISDRMISRMTVYMNPEKFFHQQLGDIFQAICSVFNSKVPVDVVTVTDELRRMNKFDSCGGSDGLKAAIDSVAFADHGEHYAKIAADYYYERQIIKACFVLSEKQDSDSLNALTKVVLTREQLGLPKIFNYKDDLYDLLDSILNKKTGRRHEVGFPTFDRHFKGLLPGEVITWGAPTNMGKSLLLTHVMSHCAQRGEPVLYIGTEMSAVETATRHLSILSGVEPYKFKLAKLSTEEMEKVRTTISDKMFPLPVRILDLPEPSLADVEAELTANRAQVVFLDYLERFRMPNEDSRRLQVNAFMRQVKNLARKYDVVIHLASQLSRETYKNEEKCPALSDLSESSSIEKESDRVMLVWAPKDKNKEAASAPGYRILEVFVAKDRHGRKGLAVDLKLDEKNLRVTELLNSPQTEATFS